MREARSHQLGSHQITIPKIAHSFFWANPSLRQFRPATMPQQRSDDEGFSLLARVVTE
jgi:hypothetical protein